MVDLWGHQKFGVPVTHGDFPRLVVNGWNL